MDSNELLVKATRKFERADLEDILEDLYTSKDLSLSKLSSIITKGRTKVTKPNVTDAKRLLNIIVPYSIVKYDIKHAMELAGIDNEEMFKIKVVRETTSNPKNIETFKNGIYKGINGKPGVYYCGKGNMKYAVLSSNELYPYSNRFKDEGTYKHQFIINATGKDYMEIVIQFIESCFSDGIPFNIVVRLPEDMKNGYPDPIRIYCTDKSLQATLDELERMTYSCKDKLIEPDWRITASIDGLYGYTQLDPKNGNKTPMEIIFDTITKVIDQELTDYDSLKGNTAVTQYDWKMRVVRLLKMKAMDNDRYEQLLDNIMNYLSEINVDLDDVFKVPTIKSLDQDIKDMDNMLSTIDNLTIEQPKKEVQSSAVMPDYNSLNSVLTNARGQARDEMPTASEVMPEKEVEVPEDLPPVGPIDEYIDNKIEKNKLSYDKLAEVLLSARDVNKKVNAFEGEYHSTEPEQHEQSYDYGSTSNVSTTSDEKALDSDRFDSSLPNDLPDEIDRKESPADPLFVQVWDEENKKKEENEQEAEEPDRMEVTQAYTPITDEMVLGSNEPKKNAPPVLPDDVKEVDPSLVDEDELVSLDTGSYAAVPVEVTGFDNNEVKSIVEAPTQGEPMNVHETMVALAEYADVLSAKEATTDVINSNGEHVSLIDYLKFEDVSKKIPFNSTVVLNDGSEVIGKEFIKKYIIPIVKNNKPDTILTVDQIINNYSTEVREPVEEKTGFFAKLFGKKKK